MALPAQPLQDVKTFGAGNILQVDTAETRLQQFYGINKLIGILRIQADGKGVNASQVLKKESLAFHDRQGCLRANVAQPQNTRAVGYYGHKVGFIC